jgi:hypothetical protein
MKEEVSLEGLPPTKKPRKRVVKKFHTTKNIPVDVAVRRQVAEEIGEAEPTKDEKFILLQKYGAFAPRIDRLVTKPKWMGVAEWKRKQNDWFKATKGLVRPQQRPRSQFQQTRPTAADIKKPWNHLQNPRPQQARRPDTNRFRPSSGRGPTGNRPN